MDGARPDRPPSGLSDTLWDLLVATWAVQHAQEPEGRPPASTVLDRLKEIVDDWGESIVPLVPEFWREDGGCRMSPRERHGIFMSFLRWQVPMKIQLRGTRRQVAFVTGSIILSSMSDQTI